MGIKFVLFSDKWLHLWMLLSVSKSVTTKLMDLVFIFWSALCMSWLGFYFIFSIVMAVFFVLHDMCLNVVINFLYQRCMLMPARVCSMVIVLMLWISVGLGFSNCWGNCWVFSWCYAFEYCLPAVKKLLYLYWCSESWD